ncbi:MAG: TetR family transcriptional regulator, partial [Mesorhizobium sp.]
MASQPPATLGDKADATAAKPLRADAQRNRDALVEA